MDVDAVTAHLHAAAAAGHPLTYAEVLNGQGLAFSRPKMRALCKLLDHIDTAERGVGRPALAVLVVRASDGLPGQGWWIAESSRGAYAGPWLGPQAAAHIAAAHAAVFDWWATATPR